MEGVGNMAGDKQWIAVKMWSGRSIDLLRESLLRQKRYTSMKYQVISREKLF